MMATKDLQAVVQVEQETAPLRKLWHLPTSHRYRVRRTDEPEVVDTRVAFVPRQNRRWSLLGHLPD
jgi:hypothetical protein